MFIQPRSANSAIMPAMAARVKKYSKDYPIFDEYGVQAEIDKAQLANVQLAGFVGDPRAFLATQHIYVQPSRSEGFCVAAHEAKFGVEYEKESADVLKRTLISHVRKQPFSVVLLDEFEKAHPRIWDLFLQVFDDARLTDTLGQVADFRHCLIIMTTNLGATSHQSAGLGNAITEPTTTATWDNDAPMPSPTSR